MKQRIKDLLKMPYIHDDYILFTDEAKKLFHEHAKNQPIIDYHNHLPPEDIANDRQYNTITEATLEGDHYKWRAMRWNGINESLITGEASEIEKWKAWANTIPSAIRNPVYVWQHLELKRYFGIDTLLSAESAESIYHQINEQLTQKDFSCRGLLKKMKVESLCTTDDPADNLEHHIRIKNDNFEIKVLPTFRPDKIILLDNLNNWNEYLDKLGASANKNIDSYDDLLTALQQRHDYFSEQGCRLSDHGLLHPFATDHSESEVKSIFQKAKEKKQLSIEEINKFSTAMMIQFGKMNHEKNWTMQLHIGPMRNNSTRLFNEIGRDSGFDSMGDRNIAEDLSHFLNILDKENMLPKTILYNLNPKDNYTLATMCGNFMDGSTPGKVQFGSGWWFLDTKEGMEAQMNALSNSGLLSRFVGMLTDSRSFLSFPRHEYFRRILCNLIGEDVSKGEIPNEMNWLGEIIENISYKNAKSFFNF